MSCPRENARGPLHGLWKAVLYGATGCSGHAAIPPRDAAGPPKAPPGRSPCTHGALARASSTPLEEGPTGAWVAQSVSGRACPWTPHARRAVASRPKALSQAGIANADATPPDPARGVCDIPDEEASSLHPPQSDGFRRASLAVWPAMRQSRQRSGANTSRFGERNADCSCWCPQWGNGGGPWGFCGTRP